MIILVSRGKGRIISWLVILSIIMTILFVIVSGYDRPGLILAALLIPIAVLAWCIGKPLNEALEEAYGMNGERPFRFREVFDIQDFSKPMTEQGRPFHSFMFIKLEYSAYLLGFVALIDIVWSLLPFSVMGAIFGEP